MALDLDPHMVAQAKVGASALAGGIIYHAIRPASSFAKMATRLVSSILCGFIFTAPSMLYFGIPEPYTGAVGASIGLLGLAVAGGILRAVERFDFSAFFKGSKPS